MYGDVPNHKIILLLFHNCKFATVMNHSVNVCYVGYLIFDPYGSHDSQIEKQSSKLRNTHSDNYGCKMVLPGTVFFTLSEATGGILQEEPQIGRLETTVEQ